MHEPGSRRFGATTAGRLQLDGASLLCASQPEHRSTRKELEGEMEEGERGHTHTQTHTALSTVLCLANISPNVSFCLHLAPDRAAKRSLDCFKKKKGGNRDENMEDRGDRGESCFMLCLASISKSNNDVYVFCLCIKEISKLLVFEQFLYR